MATRNTSSGAATPRKRSSPRWSRRAHQARALLEDIRNKPDEASRNSQMGLGEFIANAIEYKREVDTKMVIDVLDELPPR